LLDNLVLGPRGLRQVYNGLNQKEAA
jgi:hypothetical protein